MIALLSEAAQANTTAVAAAVATFLAVFPAELPDKTMVATLVLTTRFRRPFAVWCGVAAAFTVHVVLAVILGKLLSELPTRPVNAAVAILFGVGAVILWRSADEEEDTDTDTDVVDASGFGGIAGRSFAVVLLAEFGDLTQLTTAGMAARTGMPVPVAVGALAALWSVAAIGAVAGQQLLRVLPLRLVRRIAAVIFAGLALWTAVEAIRG